MPGIDVKLGSYDERMAGSERFYNSEESLETDNQSTTSSTESRQSDFQKKEHEFIPTRSSGILASKPAANPAQFTRINSNPLLISAQKQMLLVDEVKKKKEEIKVGEDIPDWQSNLDVWKSRRRKQSEDAITRVSEIKRIEEQEFMQNVEKRKLSIGKKLSIQVANDDEINWDDLGLDSAEIPASSSTSVTSSVGSSAKSVLNGSRKDSRGPSQESDIIEEKEPDEDHDNNTSVENANLSPYEDAIEGYKSFAKSHLPSEEKPVEKEKPHVNPVKLASSPSGLKDKTVTKSGVPPTLTPSLPVIAVSVLSVKNKIENSSLSKDSSPSKSSSASSITSKSSPLSSLSANSPSPVSTASTDKEDLDTWKEKIDTFTQPTRRVSNELSNNIKLKVASFEDNRNKDSPVSRNIELDETFTDKLKVFKSIETNQKNESSPGLPKRRDSEPPTAKFKGFPALKSSSSSSFMNTYQNNKFFQQNSLGSENDDENEDNHLVDDALEESFFALEDISTEKVVFKDDDFLPDISKLPPPDEKPPPLPSVPPPGLDDVKLEDDIDKQEREIIESLEREEQEQNKYLESLSSPRGKVPTDSMKNGVESQTPKTQFDKTTPPKNEHFDKPTPSRNEVITKQKTPTQEPLPNISEPVVPAVIPRKKEKFEAPPKDYNKHWLIQEAEQRRITEAKQRQIKNPVKNHQNYEKYENVNNNSGHVIDNEVKAQQKLNGGFANGGLYNGEKKMPLISDNIYANVDSSTKIFNKSQGTQFETKKAPEPAGVSPQIPGPQVQIPGPQVPPRGGDGQDRVLSVSGKKKCSHCKDELGRGAAMIIESLRLFYHIRCFQCCVCSVQLGNGSAGTDVRVRNNKLHCQNCYSNDEGLKFSKV